MFILGQPTYLMFGMANDDLYILPYRGQYDGWKYVRKTVHKMHLDGTKPFEEVMIMKKYCYLR